VLAAVIFNCNRCCVQVPLINWLSAVPAVGGVAHRVVSVSEAG
jgi:hypothetical protein